MMTTLANGDISVTVDADYGARIVSLRDLVTGREWMLQGKNSADTSEDAVYGTAEAIGWDECFPTVAPWDASHTIWGRVLRDHGDLWGRPAEIVEQTDIRLVTIQSGILFSLTRALEVNGTTLRVAYRLSNRSAEDLPYLWAAHGMLRVAPDDRIVLPGIDMVIATYLARDGDIDAARMLRWPGPNTEWLEPFDRVHPASSRRAAKLYVTDVPGAEAYVGNVAGWLRISWSEEIDSLGIWLNYGGWPVPGDAHHIGLEPTNAPVDHLGQAIARGTAALPPGVVHEWAIEYTVRAPAP
jgi:galactose mutarotase-like enzyme